MVLSKRPKCPRCDEPMKFSDDGCSIPSYRCDECRTVLSCSHENCSNVNGQWRERVTKIDEDGKKFTFWANEEDGGWKE